MLGTPGAGPQRFKFIDGFFIEGAYDLGISMRERPSELLKATRWHWGVGAVTS